MINENKFNAAIVLKGETKADAAKVLGINPATLYRKVKGISDFRRDEIETFCKHYEADPTDIFFTHRSAQNAETVSK